MKKSKMEPSFSNAMALDYFESVGPSAYGIVQTSLLSSFLEFPDSGFFIASGYK